MKNRIFNLTIGIIVIISSTCVAAEVRFGAYYTKLVTGQNWESYSRTGDHPDIVLQLSKPEGQLVFWRGNSYLPYWKTAKGQWNMTEIVSRTGDGTEAMPDRVNSFPMQK